MLTRTIRGKAAAVALGGMLLTATAACGGQVANGPGQKDDARDVTAAETALLATAEEELVGRCMERRGFKYWPAAPPTPDELKDFPYVVDDLAWARKHGYGGDLQRKAARQQKSNPNAVYAKGLSDSRQRAYEVARTGDGKSALEVTAPNGADIAQNRTGCLARAQGRLYGDFREWFRLSTIAGNLPDHSDSIHHNARFRAAVEQWSACMEEKGHPFKSPSHLQASLVKITKGEAPREARRMELRLATAEASCARSTPLSATTRALTRQFDRIIREKYGDDIDAGNRMRLAALERARGITRGTTQDTASEK